MKLSSKALLASCMLLSVSATTVSSVEVQGQLQALEYEQFEQVLKSNKKLVEDHKMINSMIEIRDEFVQWVKKFEKVYDSLEEEVERMMIWLENHEFIQAHNNRNPKPSYTVGHNHFSDMTNDEFQKIHSLGKYSPGVEAIRAGKLKREQQKAAMHKLSGEKEEHPMVAEYRYLRSLAVAGAGDEEEEEKLSSGDDWFSFLDDDDSATAGDDAPKTDDSSTDTDDDTNGLPDSVDWVSAGAVTDVKNQQSCGSCWAFSSTGAIEGASFIKYGQLIPLSEQNLLDCDTLDNGCNGGLMENAFKYDESAKGLCSEADYPYLATGGHMCSTECQKVNGTAVSDYIDIAQKDKHGLIASIALQPTSIAMQADQLSFQFYSSGVFDDDECGRMGNVDHGVLAVGYGTDAETGKKYFTVKNSWGDGWGENGYVRLSRTSKNDWGTCAVLMIMTAPIIAWKWRVT